MKRKSSSLLLVSVGLGLFLIIFCSLVIFTGAFVGIGYAFQSFTEGTAISAYELARNTIQPFGTQMAGTDSAGETASALTGTVMPSDASVMIETPTLELPSSTPTIENSPTIELTPTFTETPVPPTETSTPTMDSTTQASNMVGEIQNLYDSGILTSTTGTYYKLPNFNKSWNQLDVYEQTPTDFYDLKNFVLRADASWQVDSNGGDWRESGCGIVFRQDKDLNHYLAYYSLDGRARLMRTLQGAPVLLGRTTIYDVDRENGFGKIMIVVQGEYINLYFNEKEIFRKRDTWIPSGSLAFTVVSGNMNGYGTQCNLSNIELWEITE